MSSTQLGSFTSIVSDPLLDFHPLPLPFSKKPKKYSKHLQDPKVLSDKTLQIISTFSHWQNNTPSWTHSTERQKFYDSMYNFKNNIKTPRKFNHPKLHTEKQPPARLRFSNLMKMSKKSEESTLLFSQKCRLSRGKNVNRHRHELLGSWEEKRLKVGNGNGGGEWKGALGLVRRESFSLLKYHYIEGIFYYPATSALEAIALMLFEISAKYIPHLYDHFKWTFLVSYLRWITSTPQHITLPSIIKSNSIDSIKLIFLQYFELLQVDSTRSILERYDVGPIAEVVLRHSLVDAKSDGEEKLRDFSYWPGMAKVGKFLEEECGLTVEMKEGKQMKVGAENHQFVVRWEEGKVYYKLNY